MSFGSRSLPKPTPAEQNRMDAIRERGICNACEFRLPLEIHHLLRYGLRISHRATVGLCGLCHGLVKTREFKERNGDEQEQLNRQDYALGYGIEKIEQRRASKGRTARPSKIIPKENCRMSQHRRRYATAQRG